MDIGNTFSAMHAALVAALAAKVNAGVLIGDGRDLAGVLLLIVVGWSLVIYVLSGDGVQAMVDSIGSLARFFIVIFLLGAWGSAVVGFLMSNTNSIALKVSGIDTIASSLNMIGTTLKNMILMPTTNGNAQDSCSSLLGVPMLYAGCKAGGAIVGGVSAAFELMDMLMAIPFILNTFIFKMLAATFLAILSAVYLLVIFMAEVLFAIAMILGPILVPWLVWQKTEWLFNGWLKFALVACFTKIIAALMVSIVATMLKSLAVLSVMMQSNASYLDSAVTGYVASFMVAVTSAVAAFLMWQVPGIAQGILSGSGGTTAQKFGQGQMGRLGGGGVVKLLGGGK